MLQMDPPEALEFKKCRRGLLKGQTVAAYLPRLRHFLRFRPFLFSLGFEVGRSVFSFSFRYPQSFLSRRFPATLEDPPHSLWADPELLCENWGRKGRGIEAMHLADAFHRFAGDFSGRVPPIGKFFPHDFPVRFVFTGSGFLGRTAKMWRWCTRSCAVCNFVILR